MAIAYGGTADDWLASRLSGRRLRFYTSSTPTVGTEFTAFFSDEALTVPVTQILTTTDGYWPRVYVADATPDLWAGESIQDAVPRVVALVPDRTDVGLTQAQVDARAAAAVAAQAEVDRATYVAQRQALPDPPTVPGAAALALTHTFPVIAANVIVIHDGTSDQPVERLCEPGGYGAGWTRDHGYVLQHQPRVFPASQRRQFVLHRLATRSTSADADPDGGFYPPDFIADRIALNGGRTFKNAGTSNLPYMDGVAFVVLSLWADWRETGDTAAFVEGRVAIDACLAALPTSATGCVWSDPADPSVDYGFTDSVKKTGDVAYGTALLAWAYRMLAEINGERGSGTYTALFNATCDGLRTLRKTSGWYAGSSGNNAAVDDVWATALVVAEGLCTAQEQQDSARALLTAYHAGTITQNGWVRHLPTGQVWVGTTAAAGTYQNGGFWATPLWDCLRAVALVNRDAAFQWGQESVAEWNRQAVAFPTGAPYEWVNGTSKGAAKYAASAALLARLAEPSTALRTTTRTEPSFDDSFQTDTSASYTLDGFVYDAALPAMRSNVNTDGRHIVRNSLVTADAGVVASILRTAAGITPALILRYADANNYIFASLGGSLGDQMVIYDRVAGVNTNITVPASLTMKSTQMDPKINEYAPYRAWVIGTTVKFQAFGYEITGTTTITAAGKVGVRRGSSAIAYAAVNRLTGYAIPTATLPADVTLVDDFGIVLPGQSTARLAAGRYRLLDAKGRTLRSGPGDAPVSVA